MSGTGLTVVALLSSFLAVSAAGILGSRDPFGTGDSSTSIVSRYAEGGATECGTPTIEPAFEHDLVLLHVAEWRGRLLRTPPRLLNAYLSRPDPWMEELAPLLEAHEVPRSFLYLALIESGMDPEARSSADAVGLWQFTPETGRQYGLRVEDDADDRTDERLSTSAAGRYLRNLFDDFGSWELAAAAYNAGPTRVREALDSSGEVDYWGLVQGKHLPPETRAYVPKFLAVLQLASERDGGSETEVAARIPASEVTAPIGLDLQ
jgi:membrane-bound lytic murein transglycosylase D